MIDFEKIGEEMFERIGVVAEQFVNELNTTATMTVRFPDSKTSIREVIPNMCVALALLRVNFKAACDEAGMPPEAPVMLAAIIEAIVTPRMTLVPTIRAD